MIKAYIGRHVYGTFDSKFAPHKVSADVQGHTASPCELWGTILCQKGSALTEPKATDAQMPLWYCARSWHYYGLHLLSDYDFLLLLIVRARPVQSMIFLA